MQSRARQTPTFFLAADAYPRAHTVGQALGLPLLANTVGQASGLPGLALVARKGRLKACPTNYASIRTTVFLNAGVLDFGSATLGISTFDSG